jgi:hypothetical protein
MDSLTKPDPFIVDVLGEYKLQSQFLHVPKIPGIKTCLAYDMAKAKQLHDRLVASKSRPNVEAKALRRTTSRSKFRQTLDDVIGPVPKGRSWKEDFPLMTEEGGCNFEEQPSMKSADAYIKTRNMSWLTQAGFNGEEAEIVMCCLTEFTVSTMMTKAICEGSDRFAAITHAAYGVVAAKASRGGVAPKCYCHMEGFDNGLADTDERWRTIEKADDTGFRGFTTHGPLLLRAASDWTFAPSGVKSKDASGEWLPNDSPVVCFESEYAEKHFTKLHTAVDTSGGTYALPPLTLLEVVRVQKPNEWDYMPPIVRWKVQFEKGSTPSRRNSLGRETIAMLDPALVTRLVKRDQDGEITCSIPTSIVVAGGCNPLYVGKYDQFDEFHDGRPCYHMDCSDGSHAYVYSDKEDLDWSIGSKPGKGNCFYYTQDPAVTPAGITRPWMVEKDGKWINDGSLTVTAGTIKTMRGKVLSEKTVQEYRISQKLITVRPTYLLPASREREAVLLSSSKFAGDRNFLTFGNTRDAARGMEDVTGNPVLTIEQEFARNDKWQDWKGQEFSAWQQWQYVVNPILPADEGSGQGSGHGERDKGRTGWTIEQVSGLQV